MNDTPYDIAVLGAGAAGLMAGIRAAERGLRVALFEKNARPGVKILMSGGTRCNLTHATDRRGIVKAFGDQGPFLFSALAALGPAELVALIEAEGVPTKVEETGKVFPCSDLASDVLEALVARLGRSTCELALGEPATGIEREGETFWIHTSRRTARARQVILTTGGQSYPGCGTRGDGYAWAEAFGHTILPRRPALTPITTDAEWVRELKGVTIADVGVRVENAAGETLSDGRPKTRGSFLFTHFGLSGPAVLDVSRLVSGHPAPRELTLVCDFLPGEHFERLVEDLGAACRAAGKKQFLSVIELQLGQQVSKRLLEVLLIRASVAADRRAAETSKAELREAVKALKATRIPISGVMGFRKAEVTAGGVSLDEVDSRTMQSKLVPGLYLAGEILDLDGPIGGYNFQAAFSTGALAGEKAGC